ncbi:hypothetical protein [Ohtaekwangia koreensis]|uniref:Uncharacterized protein n=1 Tax=Ohtaekwangia koreensis TaxID=688867 RepID=A0A1T5MKM3_9BACT|nr:hypothetical protein [Ohtaekwangia koreensis]SKC88772.1 hypothetical protein SAMN05660236_5688 [Ohtaekwangia koreensis]
MRFWLIILLLLVVASLQAQQQDSLLNALKLDSLSIPKMDALDSIQNSFYARSDSLKLEYKSKFASIDSSRSGLQEKIDSLKSLQLPADKYTQKLDSVLQQREKVVGSLNSKIDGLKSNATNKINKLELSPELQEKASALTGNIQDFKLPVKDMNIPSLDLPDNPLKNLDGLNTSIESPIGKIGELDGLQNITGKAGDLSSLTENAGAYQKDIQNITQGNLTDVKQLPQALETKAGDLAGVGDLKKSAGAIDPMLKSVESPEAMKEQAVQQVKEVAINHFAGKEQVLQEAMDKMAKLKNKYSSLNSLSEVGKKRPNEMRDKPLIERLLPGIALQIQKKGNDILVDFNPYIGYRLSGRLTSGLGWNQRYGYNTNHNSFSPSTRVYGPRIYSEFKIGKGFSPRAEVELMNTQVPPKLQSKTSDVTGREWVPGAFIGLKKEYRFIKRVKGTAQIMLRVFNYENKSPYADVLNMRIGFEFPMKKKVKPVSSSQN